MAIAAMARQPEERAVFLDAACGSGNPLRNRVEQMLTHGIGSGGGLEAPQPAASQILEKPDDSIGRYKLLQEIGEGGCGVGLHGRTGAAGSTPGRVEGHQAGHGHAAGHRPLRGGAAGAGDDGPSQHRQGARCGGDRHGPALFCDGIGAGHPHHRILRPEEALAPRAAGAVHPGLPGGPARSSKGNHSPRPQALQHPGRAARWSPVPKVIDFGIAKATAAAAHRQDTVHASCISSSARRRT